jgi:hypothetical protein
MLTRREFLLGLSLAPVVAKLPLCERALRPRMELWPEDHWLSVESASGFQALLHRELSAIHTASRHCDLVSLIILPGTRGITMERCEQLLRRMQEGAWIILEIGSCFSSLEESKQQTSLVERTFNLEVFPPVRVCESSAKDNYVAYEWPIRRLVRTFEATTPLRCKPTEIIARFAGQPVCAKKKVGRGGLVYLGSMLGPGLFAEEHEALAIGAAMIASLERSLV